MSAPAKTKYFFKANNDVLSFCACEDEPAMSSGQLDCPWCGCGWMIGCTKCSKSFIFAEVRETELSLIEIARRDAGRRGLTTVTEAKFVEWAKGMRETLENFAVGDVVVYLDGCYFSVDCTDIAFDGYYARHDLPRLPHVDALADPPLLDRILGDKQYWFDRELPDRNRD